MKCSVPISCGGSIFRRNRFAWCLVIAASSAALVQIIGFTIIFLFLNATFPNFCLLIVVYSHDI